MPRKKITDDVLSRKVLTRGTPAAEWMNELARQYFRRFVPGRHPPTIVITAAPSPNHFCGRHFPQEGVIALCISGDPKLTRGTLVHELSHSARKYHGDPKGKHDLSFLKQAYAAYRYFGVPRHIAVNIDPELKAVWPKH